MTGTERELIGVERISEYMNVETEIEANKPEDEKKAKPYQVIPEDNEPSQDIEIEMNTFLEITLDQTEKKSILSFKDVSMKYSPNSQNYTLKDINFEVFPKEKIAICGRTGSGKTSILNCLMKLYKVDKGKIFLAGQNIEDIRTKKLRNEIVSSHHLINPKAMIPQSGFLFEATVRDNLDPFNLVKREKIQSILKMGKDIVAKSLKDSKSTSSTNKIFNEDLMIERGAKNLSLGEKQILNLLRVLLRDNQLILLDEATSNIDPITGISF